MVLNTQLIMCAAPVNLPIPGETLKKAETEIDIDTVSLDGGILMKTLALSLDPAQRGRMNIGVKSYAASYEVGKPISGYLVGRVVRSEHPRFEVGQVMCGFASFETYSVIPKSQLDGHLTHLYYTIPDSHGLNWTTWVGAAGMSGQTAWWAYKKLAGATSTSTIYISAAAGSVGQIVAQLAKRDGLKVIGSAGSDAKVEWLKSLGCFDVAFNYKTESTQDILAANPFDIFVDTVGGEILDTVLATINRFGRIVSVGSVSQYNLTLAERHRLLNYPLITGKELDIRGFIISSAPGKDLSEFFATIPALIANGEIRIREHVTHGIDNGEALVDMLTGKAEGKAVISME